MRRLPPLIALSIPSLLACGGVWAEASKQAVGQTCRDLSKQLEGVEDGPHKARADQLFAQCATAGDAGQLTIIGVARFSAEVQGVVDDDQISDAEMLALENAYDALVAAGD